MKIKNPISLSEKQIQRLTVSHICLPDWLNITSRFQAPFLLVHVALFQRISISHVNNVIKNGIKQITIKSTKDQWSSLNLDSCRGSTRHLSPPHSWSLPYSLQTNISFFLSLSSTIFRFSPYFILFYFWFIYQKLNTGNNKI